MTKPTVEEGRTVSAATLRMAKILGVKFVVKPVWKLAAIEGKG